jgi:hypothetical protein
MRTATYRFGGWPAENATLHVVENRDDLDYLDAWLKEREGEYLGVDSETNALDPFEYGFQCRMVQMADLYESFVVPVWVNEPADTYAFGGNRQRHLSHLIRRHPRWVAHYAEADERFVSRGLPGDPVRWEDEEPHFSDTQAVLAVYDPRTVTTHSKKDRIHPRIPRQKGLKETTTRLLTPTLEAAEAALHARFKELAPRKNFSKRDLLRWGFANIDQDDPAYVLYAALDPLATIRLWHLMRFELERRGQWPRTLAALKEQWIIDGATYRGMPVDAPYVRWLDEQLAAVVDGHTPFLAEHEIKPSGLGPSVGLAFKRLGIAESPNTDRDGKEKWDKDAMKALVGRADDWLAAHEGRLVEAAELNVVHRVRGLATAVLDVRKAGKYRSTWVAPMLWTIDHADGVMHPSVRGTGTVTTRMTCQKSATAGPLHSAPKDDTRLRAAVQAPHGWVVVSADFKQAEPTVMAALSGDQDYLADLLAGDINSVLAVMVYQDAYDARYGKTPGHPSYKLRQACKFSWLAWCYGASDAKVDTLLGVTTGVTAQWRARYPVFAAYRDACNEQQTIQLDSGHVVPLWDRVWVDDTGELRQRTYPSGGLIPSRLGLNGATQGTQADLLKLSMHKLSAWGWAWALRFFVHDELVGMVPAWMAETFAAVLTEAMTVRYRGVVIGCDATIEGRTWQPQPREFSVSDLPDLEVEDDVAA